MIKASAWCCVAETSQPVSTDRVAAVCGFVMRDDDDDDAALRFVLPWTRGCDRVAFEEATHNKDDAIRPSPIFTTSCCCCCWRTIKLHTAFYWRCTARFLPCARARRAATINRRIRRVANSTAQHTAQHIRKSPAPDRRRESYDSTGHYEQYY